MTTFIVLDAKAVHTPSGQLTIPSLSAGMEMVYWKAEPECSAVLVSEKKDLWIYGFMDLFENA